MSVMREPWVQPGLNYSDIHHPEDFCKQDGGSWNATGKWCTPIPPATVEQLIGNATAHGHNYIAYNKGVKSQPGKFCILVLMLSIVMTFASAAILSPVKGDLMLERATNGTNSPQLESCVKRDKRAVMVGDGNPHQSCL